MPAELIYHLVKNITAPEIDGWFDAAIKELNPDLILKLKTISSKRYEDWSQRLSTKVFYYLEFYNLEFCIKPVSISSFYYGETWGNIICNLDKRVLQTVLDQKTEELNKATVDDFKRFKRDHLTVWFKNNIPARIKDETVVRWVNELFASKFIQSEFDHHYNFTRNLWRLISKSGLDKKTILETFNSRNDINKDFLPTCKEYIVPLDSTLSPEHFFKAAVIYEFADLFRKTEYSVDIKLFPNNDKIGCEIGGYSDLEIDTCINNYLGNKDYGIPNLLNNIKLNYKIQYLNILNNFMNNYDQRIDFFNHNYNGSEYCNRFSIKQIKELKLIMISDYKAKRCSPGSISNPNLKKIYYNYIKAATILKISHEDFELMLNKKSFWCRRGGLA